MHVVLPDDQAKEKSDLLKQLGADVTIVPCCAIANPNHYVNAARKISEQVSMHGVVMMLLERHVCYVVADLYQQYVVYIAQCALR